MNSKSDSNREASKGYLPTQSSKIESSASALLAKWEVSLHQRRRDCCPLITKCFNFKRLVKFDLFSFTLFLLLFWFGVVRNLRESGPDLEDQASVYYCRCCDMLYLLENEDITLRRIIICFQRYLLSMLPVVRLFEYTLQRHMVWRFLVCLAFDS
jgi:hypothetical protein